MLGLTADDLDDDDFEEDGDKEIVRKMRDELEDDENEYEYDDYDDESDDDDDGDYEEDASA